MVPVPHHRLDFAFSPDALSEQIVRGVLAHDPVRVERSIAAALEIHGCTERAERLVFAGARRAAAGLGPGCGAAVAEAIDAHLNQRRAPEA
jgi:hypothetical protein